MKVVEEMTQVKNSLWCRSVNLTDCPPLLHEVCDLRNRELQQRLVLYVCSEVVKAETACSEHHVSYCERQPRNLDKPRQMTSWNIARIHLYKLFTDFKRSFDYGSHKVAYRVDQKIFSSEVPLFDWVYNLVFLDNIRVTNVSQNLESIKEDKTASCCP